MDFVKRELVAKLLRDTCDVIGIDRPTAIVIEDIEDETRLFLRILQVHSLQECRK